MTSELPKILPIIGNLPDGFRSLIAEASGQGYEFVERFHTAWLNGDEHCVGPGEGLFAAFVDGRLAGMAAVMADPYARAPNVGRLRHVFVMEAARRKGVAAALVETCLERGRVFELIRLRTRNPDAARLYQRLGFTPVALEDASHIYRRG
ncbi:MAG: GNAT family N-acetyltransferase [Hyphomicrobiales bacterium]